MIVFLSALLATAQRGSANTITVNSLANTQANDGVCTLREAIINANNDDQSGSTDCAAGSGADTINIVVPGEIVLNGTAANLPTITSDMTINGLGANQTTITGPLSGGAGFNGSYRCFFVQSGNVTISNMTIRKGVTPLAQSGNGDEVGGGILNVNGSLALNGVTISQCQAGALHFQNGTTGFLAVGGGVGSLGPLTITNCTFTNNAAYGGNGTSTGGAAGGGAIYIQGFPLTITGSTIDPNQAQSGQGSNTSSVAYGGGIYAGDSTVTISNSSISHNVANSDSQAVTGTAEGGGITVVGTGTLTVNNNSQILSNKCFSPDPTGGGSSPNGAVYGGGIYTESATTISDSSVSSNSAQSGNISNGWAGPVAGGGIYSKAPLTITNTHVDSNSLTQGNSNIGENAWGGGIFWNVDGTNGTALTITGSSISSNKINAFTDSGTGSNHSQSFGGGLALFGPVTSGSATFSLTNSQVVSNSVVGATYNTTSNSGGDAAGGGMWLVSSIAVTITNTSISNNSVVGGSGTTLGSAEGGGIDNGVSLPMSISGSTISGNSATDQEGAGYGGGISNGATVSITDTTLSGNSGINGGAINNRFTTNTLKLLRCTLSGNSCTASGFTGGAIDNSGTLFATNSTFSGNLTPQCTTGECGGAVWSANAATLTNCTLTNNQTVTGTSAPNVTGIFRYDGTVTLKDTIVAGKVNPSTFADVFYRTNGTTGSGFVSQGYNLIGNVGAVTTFTQIGDQTGT
ncbi:MAG: hypothetical protein JOZ43_02670, partial [Acidobacteriales bacterium]|nr:hypothetical protein [Terriglobales bacterium]